MPNRRHSQQRGGLGLSNAPIPRRKPVSFGIPFETNQSGRELPFLAPNDDAFHDLRSEAQQFAMNGYSFDEFVRLKGIEDWPDLSLQDLYGFFDDGGGQRRSLKIPYGYRPNFRGGPSEFIDDEILYDPDDGFTY